MKGIIQRPGIMSKTNYSHLTPKGIDPTTVGSDLYISFSSFPD